MFIEQEDPFRQTLDAIAEDEGLFVYDLEKVNAGSLRVFIDRPRTKSGTADSQDEAEVKSENVSSDDCSRLCRRLMVFMSVEGPDYGFSTEPQIEVSSPGLDRKLRTASHFSGAVGQKIRLTVWERGEDDRKKKQTYVGLLKDFKDGVLQFAPEGKDENELEIAFDNVEKARVEFEF